MWSACSAADLAVYGEAVASGSVFIPAGALSAYPATAIQMPPVPRDTFIVEPWVATDAIDVTLQPDGSSMDISWQGSNKWVEVTLGLIGDVVSVWLSICCVMCAVCW